MSHDPSLQADPQRIRAVIERLVRDGSMVARSDGSTHDVRTVAISPQEGEALARWVAKEEAARTIEIGLGYGMSTLYLCEGLVRSGTPDPRHLALDPFQSTRFAGCGLQVLEEAGVRELLEYHDARSESALPAFLDEGRQFDFAFVDGNHLFDGVFIDLFYLGRLVRKGGAIALDDTNLPGIRRAIAFFLTNLGWTIEEESRPDDEHHWVVLRTTTAPDQRDFRYFVDF